MVDETEVEYIIRIKSNICKSTKTKRQRYFSFYVYYYDENIDADKM